MLEQHAAFAEVAVSRNVPAVKESTRSAEWWSYLKEANGAVTEAEEAIVDTWNEQTNVQSGRGLKTLGRTVMEQVRSSLEQDRERLRRRTQLNRSEAVPLGSGKRYDQAENHEVEMFDDADFYGNLLKQFLQSTGSTVSASQATRFRKRKHKQHRSSKSRLNMEIQEKLLNFMAPLSTNVLPPMADPLFASLFGRVPQ